MCPLWTQRILLYPPTHTSYFTFCKCPNYLLFSMERMKACYLLKNDQDGLCFFKGLKASKISPFLQGCMRYLSCYKDNGIGYVSNLQGRAWIFFINLECFYLLHVYWNSIRIVCFIHRVYYSIGYVSNLRLWNIVGDKLQDSAEQAVPIDCVCLCLQVCWRVVKISVHWCDTEAPSKWFFDSGWGSCMHCWSEILDHLRNCCKHLHFDLFCLLKVSFAFSVFKLHFFPLKF